MNFRKATLNDLKTLNSISLQSKAYWGYPNSWIEEWREELTIVPDQFQNQNILVIEKENQIIAFSSIGENNKNYEILHLWVLPEHIGKGIGKRLLDKIIETFVTLEKPILVLSDPHAESFYQKQGFVTFDQVESFPKGRFLPLMKK